MKNYSSFDVLGPIMVGPSSSHTAGAARLGKIASEIAGQGFYKVEFYLHGSFAKTYKGHGTNKALVAGILGFEPDDERLRDSFDIAKSKSIDYEFIESDLGYVHPNTVKLVFKYLNNDDFYVIGSSIGGGSIVIININGIEIEFTGSYPTIIVKYKDKKGMISNITSIIADAEVNIASMKVTRDRDDATMICEMDSQIDEDTINNISNIEDLSYIRFINTKRS
ncbi:MAG: L-serine ammonia-lyase, iron-sulfur-dependent subunit beta [Tissierellia bacterium]|nr:L-serine ammonia-lyase, iron-sulfur-dependent subunit beta [Tissierellia bacterium]MDD4725262.1 L-serine ammonia-lyase, iron-sulfur-dependent subunit beta [Tissierellia bacterium]